MIDFHTHLFPDHTQLHERAGNRAQLREMADRYELSRYVVLPLFGQMHPSRGEIEAANDAAHALAGEDARVAPFALVYPPHPWAVEEAERRLNAQNFAGVKVWCSLADQRFMDPVMELMAATGKPILIHALHKAWDYPQMPGGQYPLESRPHHIAALARRHPDAKIVMAHAGGDFLWSSDVIRNCRNVWTDISGTYCETGMVEHLVETLGGQRVIFGTDMPGAAFITNYAKVAAATISEADRRRIFHDNAAELLA